MRRRKPRRPGIFSKERTPEASEAALRRDVLLSLQRALWDMVTPQLRGIAASIDRPRITARFLYETVTPEETEIVSEVATSVAADFLPPLSPDFLAIALSPPSPRELDAGEFWVYLRREATDVDERGGPDGCPQ